MAARVFRVRQGEALTINETPFGSAGEIFRGEGIEAVWVSKGEEAIDPGWFSQSSVDLIVVLQGRLRVEFQSEEETDTTLEPGDVLVLPAETRCRAYRWPRESRTATKFLAVYPIPEHHAR
jgi:uncharacterized protein YjlB